MMPSASSMTWSNISWPWWAWARFVWIAVMRMEHDIAPSSICGRRPEQVVPLLAAGLDLLVRAFQQQVHHHP